MLNHGKPTHWWSQKSANCFVHIDHSKAPWPYSTGCYSALQRSEAIWLRTSNKIKCIEVAQNGKYWSYCIYLFMYFFKLIFFWADFLLPILLLEGGRAPFCSTTSSHTSQRRFFFLDFFHIFFGPNSINFKISLNKMN